MTLNIFNCVDLQLMTKKKSGPCGLTSWEPQVLCRWFCVNIFKLDHFYVKVEQEFSVSTKRLNLSGWKSL